MEAYKGMYDNEWKDGWVSNGMDGWMEKERSTSVKGYKKKKRCLKMEGSLD